MSRLSNIANASLVDVLANFNFTKAVLAINLAAAATVKTTLAISYTIGGVLLTKAALAAQSIAVTHREDASPVTAGDPAYVQPAQQTVIYLLALNAAGTLAVIQGGFAGQVVRFSDNSSKVLTSVGGVPALPVGFAVIGALKVATAPATTFTPGTTALDAAGVTVTYFDLAMVPYAL